SFYLQLLVESILEKIKSELGLFDLNIIYASGGGFYLLAPNTDSNKGNLTKLEGALQETLFEEYEGELNLSLEYEVLSCQDLFDHLISEKWRTLGENINKKKRQKFKQLITTQYSIFFEPISVNGDEDTDAITGQALLHNAVKISEDDDEVVINRSTYEQIQLGKELRSVDYWVKSHEQISYWNHKSYDPAQLGVYHYIVDKSSILKYKDRLKGSIDRRTA